MVHVLKGERRGGLRRSTPDPLGGHNLQRSKVIDELVSRIATVDPGHPTRVAVDGVDAAGKTTLCNELVAPLESLGRHVVRASVDRFHNPAAIRLRRGEASPEGYFHDSFDYSSLIDTLLRPFGPSGSRRFRRAVFDYLSDSSVDSPVEEARLDSILLFDGVFLMRPELRDHWDLSIFVQADFAETVSRAELRDRSLFGSADAVRRRYEQRYVPGQQLYLSECSPEHIASIVIDNNDPEQPTITRAA